MRVLHCCLAAFYIDNYSYQENILPKMHMLQGHDVAILASTETYVDNAVLGYVTPGSYHTKEGIPVTRIPYTRAFPHFLAKKLRIYKGVTRFISDFKPDVIFLHDCQFISINEIATYARKHPGVRIYVDGHTDLINSARGWISKNILHKVIYRWCAKRIEPFTRKFYGVLPLRADFFRDIYGVSPEKVDLLFLGADHTVADFSKRTEISKRIRKELGINEDDFVIVTGGKIDRRKNIHVLMKAVHELGRHDIKLIVFGTPNVEMKDEIEALAKSVAVKYLGWIPSEKAYDYFLTGDLAFFPGTHSVLWEQAVGLGLPCVFKKWTGMQHVDLGGNCLFTDSDDIDEIKKKIMLLYGDRGLLMNMKRMAEQKGIPEFSYYEIAKRAIEE